MPVRRLPLVIALGALLVVPALAEDSSPSGREGESAFGRFLRDHGVHLLVAFAVDRGAQIYHRTAGYSQTPLLFQDPASIEWNLQRAVAGPSSPGDYLGSHGLETLRYGVPVALIGMNFGDGRSMVEDLMGYLEGHLVVRGATNLGKDVLGRQRPYFESVSSSKQPRLYEKYDETEDAHRSFPSGHASGSFFFASYLDRAIAREVGPRSVARAFSFAGLYGTAGWIGWTRMRRDKHYLSDIVAGAALGIAISRTSYRINHPREYSAGTSRAGRRGSLIVRLLPPAPVPGGAVLGVSITSASSSGAGIL